MLLQGSEIVVRTLMEQGVDLVYGFPGGMVVDLYDALYSHTGEIRHVLVAHEQGAAHAADGYARATGRVGVCIATSGPGATNLVTGIATAYLDSVPMVIITGNVPQENIGTDSFQEIDITGITLPITKHNYFISDVRKLASSIREAFRIARSGRPGPVLVDITKNAQVDSCAWEPMPPALPDKPLRAYTRTELLSAAEAINSSARPYVYFGGGAIACDASKEIMTLADLIDAPIGCSLMGISGVPASNPRYLGMEGMHGRLASTLAMQECDCLIALGVRFTDRSTGSRKEFKQKGSIIHVDVDASELSKNTSDTFALAGDVKVALQELLPLIVRRARANWSEYVEGLRSQEDMAQDSREGLTPRNVMGVLNGRLDANTTVITDVGQHQMWAAQHLSFTRPRSFVTSGGLGTMGFGLGAAIGSAMGTDGRSVLVTGDGSFAMCCNELATAVRERIPVVVLIMNNAALGMVRQWQRLFYDKRYSATTYDGRKTDFVALAEAFGADGARVENLEQLERAFDVAFEMESPYVIDCAIGQDELVLPMMPPGGSLQDVFFRVGE